MNESSQPVNSMDIWSYRYLDLSSD